MKNECINLMLISSYPPPVGGISTWTKQYMDYFQFLGVDISLINTSVVGKSISQHDKKNIYDELVRSRKIASSIKKTMKVRKIDIIHYNTSCSLFGMLRDSLCVFPYIRNKKIVIQCHCDVSNYINSKIKEKIFSYLAKKADLILCLNSMSQDKVKQLTKTKCIIVPNFYDPEEITVKKHDHAKKVKEITYIGHVRESKGINEFISVAQKKPELHYNVVGHIGSEFREQKQSGIDFFGELSKQDVMKKLIQTDILLFPSHAEGFPLSVLEAMVVGVPIIATNVGSVADMIEDKGGITVDVGDVSSMVSAIEQLEDVALRTCMGRWNSEKAEESYSIQAVLEHLKHIYIDVLSVQ